MKNKTVLLKNRGKSVVVPDKSVVIDKRESNGIYFLAINGNDLTYYDVISRDRDFSKLIKGGCKVKND